jgi:tetratricopeptide (TPR) repeat protein
MDTALNQLEALAQTSRDRQRASLRRNLIINAVLVLASATWLIYTLNRVTVAQERLDRLNAAAAKTESTRLALDRQKQKLEQDIGTLAKDKAELEREKQRLEEALDASRSERARVLESIEQATNTGSLAKVKQVVANELGSKGQDLWQRGFSTFQQGNKDEAAQLYQQAIQAQPGLPAPYNSLGRLEYEKGDLAGAETLYLEALERSPGYVPALHNLSLVAWDQKNYARARELNDRALKLRPGFKNAMDLRAALDKIAPR